MVLEDDIIESVRELYIRYAPDVYRLALSSTRNFTEAEDVVQEVFLRVLRNQSLFRGDAHAKTWIWSITKNYLIDAARKRTQHYRLLAGIRLSHRPEFLDTLVEVEDLLGALREPQRRIVNLRVIKDLSVTDTAKLLQCSEGKVRTDTHRALAQLKEYIK